MPETNIVVQFVSDLIDRAKGFMQQNRASLTVKQQEKKTQEKADEAAQGSQKEGRRKQPSRTILRPTAIGGGYDVSIAGYYVEYDPADNPTIERWVISSGDGLETAEALFTGFTKPEPIDTFTETINGDTQSPNWSSAIVYKVQSETPDDYLGAPGRGFIYVRALHKIVNSDSGVVGDYAWNTSIVANTYQTNRQEIRESNDLSIKKTTYVFSVPAGGKNQMLFLAGAEQVHVQLRTRILQTAYTYSLAGDYSEEAQAYAEWVANGSVGSYTWGEYKDYQRIDNNINTDVATDLAGVEEKYHKACFFVSEKSVKEVLLPGTASQKLQDILPPAGDNFSYPRSPYEWITSSYVYPWGLIYYISNPAFGFLLGAGSTYCLPSFLIFEEGDEIEATSELFTRSDVEDKLIDAGYGLPPVLLETCKLDGTCTALTGSTVIGWDQTRSASDPGDDEIPSSEFSRNSGRKIERILADPEATDSLQSTIYCWDWGQPGVCQRKLADLGFSPADLTP